MILTLQREAATKNSTPGRLFVDGEFFCYTLEDPVRPAKIKGVTAIPPGRYEVILNFSNRFGRMLPLLLNVPNYLGVRIHSGNTAEDTEGCILVGRKRARDRVDESRLAFNPLMKRMEAAIRSEKIYVEIKSA